MSSPPPARPTDRPGVRLRGGPSGVGGNEYYPTEAAYLDAVADALHVQYAAIVEASFTLQIDDPFLTDVFILIPGQLQPGDPSDDRVGQVRVAGRGRPAGQRLSDGHSFHQA